MVGEGLVRVLGASRPTYAACGRREELAVLYDCDP
jgi:hypothetical protein